MTQIDYSHSYPPLFRPRTTTAAATASATDHHHHDPTDAKLHNPDFDPLPVIDFECISNEKLHEACREWGMFRLVNHGIPATLLRQLHRRGRQLFSLPFEHKQESFRNPISYFWGTPGLTPSGEPIPTGSVVRKLNWIEGFHVILNPSLTEVQYEDPVLDSFRCALDEYGRHQSRVTATIFELLAQNLEWDSTRTKSYISPAKDHLRVQRYPRCFELSDDPKSQPSQWGIDVHTDSSIMSILHQDDVGGLQVLTPDNRWLDVKPHFDSLVVNLGDMMQAMSNDAYVAATHRVKVNKHLERVSLGYFILPNGETVIESPKYRPFTYEDFRAEVQQDLKTVGRKIGLPKFRLRDRRRGNFGVHPWNEQEEDFFFV